MFDPFNDEFVQHEMEHNMLEIMKEMVSEVQIRWEPKEESFSSLLEAYTKDQLLELGYINQITVRQSWKKSQIVEELENHILETLEERILLFDAEFQEILLAFLKEPNDAFESIQDKMVFYLELCSQLVQLGLVFIQKDGIDFKIYVPDELTEYVKTLEKRTARPEVKERIEFAENLKEVLTASIHLYGVVEENRILDLWRIRHSMEDSEILRFYRQFYRVLPILLIQKEYLTPDVLMVASEAFESDKEALMFYQKVKNKMGDDYYRPSASEIQYYGKHLFDQRSRAYKQMFRIVKKLSMRPKAVMHILEQQLLLGQPLSVVMEEIHLIEELIFDSERQIEQFAQVYIQLNNHARLWENAGYTPTELGRNPMAEASSIMPPLSERKPRQPVIHVEKIGRNDPCPCGSGKKYKKCCMKK